MIIIRLRRIGHVSVNTVIREGMDANWTGSWYPVHPVANIGNRNKQ